MQPQATAGVVGPETQRPRHGDPWIVALAAGLLLLTVAVLAVPDLRITTRAPRVRIALETAGVVVAAAVAAVAYLRWSITGSRRSLFVALAFLSLASSRVVTLVLQPDVGYETYTWSVGRLVAAVLLLVGAFQPAPRGIPMRPGITFLWSSVAVLGVVGLAQGTISALHDMLPPTTAFPRSSTAWHIVDAAPVLVAMGMLGAALFVAAYISYRRRPSVTISAWFLAALVLGAFSHAHYVITPTAFSYRLSTGDGLRLAFIVFLLFAVLSEVRRGYLGEYDRASRLAEEAAEHRQRIEELELLDRSRIALARVVSHELMHPVAAIRALAHALRVQWHALPEDERLRFLDAVERESQQLGQLAEDTSALGAFHDEPFPVDPRPVRIGDALGSIERSLEHLGDRISLHVTEEARGATACIDLTRMTQVLHNLVSNSARHAGDGSVEVDIGVSDDELLVRVIDHGPGIPAQRMPTLFERPHGEGNGERASSGLGLLICRRIVDGHHGRIWAESSPEGTTVAFTVPLQGAEA